MSQKPQNINNFIVENEVRNNLKNELQSIYSQTKDILNDLDEIWNINLKLLTSWGAALGGIMLPVKSWIEKEYPELSYEEVILVLAGAIVGVYYDNETTINNIVRKIKSKNLFEEFKQSFKISKLLSKSLTNLLNDFGIYGNENSDMIGLAFILPLLDDLKSIVNQGDTKQIANEIINSGVILTSNSQLKFFLTKLSKFSE
jgi:RNAse (barnase) inhibitor barstar